MKNAHLTPYSPYNHPVQPPASIKALGDPIYEAFYGLKEQPFAITTDPKFFFLAASHQRAFSELLNGLRRREGLLLVTGETGAGKTTLCRAVIEALGDRTFAAMILNPYMTGAEVLRIVLRDFGLVSHEDLRRGALASADVPQLLDTLEGFLQSLAPLGSHAVIVLDEAQSVPPQTLDQLRLLTALEQGGQRLVQVVLCGQAGLLNTLKSDALSALNERITRRVELAPMPPDQVEAYIQHRLGVAGGTEAVSFQPAAARIVADLSRGVPRRINVLCDRSLQEGRIEGVSVITPELVKRAAKALAGVHEPITAAPVAPPAPVKVAAPAAPAPQVAKRQADTPAPPPSSAHASTSAAPAPRITTPAPGFATLETDLAVTVPPPTRPTADADGTEARTRTKTSDVPALDDTTTAAVPSPAASAGMLFGQSLGKIEEPTAPASNRRWWKVGLAVLALGAVGAAAYFGYARTIPPPETVLGPVPVAPARPGGQPAEALPVPVEPTTAPVNGADQPVQGGPLSPPPTTPAPAAGSPSEPPPSPAAPALPQVPGEGNQVN
jgi:type II secretory pathway predicted ATPase ExeA